MSTQIARTDLPAQGIARAGGIRRLGLFILFFICGFIVLILGSNYFQIFATNKNVAYNLIVSAVLLGAALWLRGAPRGTQYWQIAFAFFTASLAYPITWLLDGGIVTILGWFRATASSSQGIAIEKVYEVLLIVTPILVVTKLSGADLGSIYLKRGDLKLGLFVGGLVWSFLATAAFMFSTTRFTSTEALGAAVVWGLVFSSANGFMEELWLRGIFLRRLEPVLGIGGSVLLTSILFALLHSGAMYMIPAAIPFIVANTLAIGLACGTLMMKTDSIWGAVLIHAGSDFFLFIALFASV